MLERIRDKNILVIYGAIFLLGIAYGVSIALTALHLDARHFSERNIGTLAAWFASGIVLLSLPMSALIRRFSAKTTLVTAMAGYAVCVALFPLLESYPAIATARFFDGACSVGIWVSSETILLSRAERQNKAFVTSLYAIAIAASVFVMATLDRDERHATHDAHAHGSESEPAEPYAPTTGLGILWRIKTSCFATFAYGYFQASVVLFLPLFLMKSKGIAEDKTILIPAFFAAGMLLFSNVAGRLGDRLGHLVVMRYLAAIGMVMVAGFVFVDRYELMVIAVFIAGATLASISPVSLALQGVITHPRDYSRSNAIYNVFYAAGMLLGPPISGALGGTAMLFHLAAMWAAFVLFTVVFVRDDPASRRVATAEVLVRS